MAALLLQEKKNSINSSNRKLSERTASGGIASSITAHNYNGGKVASSYDGDDMFPPKAKSRSTMQTSDWKHPYRPLNFPTNLTDLNLIYDNSSKYMKMPSVSNPTFSVVRARRRSSDMMDFREAVHNASPLTTSITPSSVSVDEATTNHSPYSSNFTAGSTIALAQDGKSVIDPTLFIRGSTDPKWSKPSESTYSPLLSQQSMQSFTPRAHAENASIVTYTHASAATRTSTVSTTVPPMRSILRRTKSALPRESPFSSSENVETAAAAGTSPSPLDREKVFSAEVVVSSKTTIGSAEMSSAHSMSTIAAQGSDEAMGDVDAFSSQCIATLGLPKNSEGGSSYLSARNGHQIDSYASRRNTTHAGGDLLRTKSALVELPSHTITAVTSGASFDASYHQHKLAKSAIVPRSHGHSCSISSISTSQNVLASPTSSSTSAVGVLVHQASPRPLLQRHASMSNGRLETELTFMRGGSRQLSSTSRRTSSHANSSCRNSTLATGSSNKTTPNSVVHAQPSVRENGAPTSVSGALLFSEDDAKTESLSTGNEGDNDYACRHNFQKTLQQQDEMANSKPPSKLAIMSGAEMHSYENDSVTLEKQLSLSGWQETRKGGSSSLSCGGSVPIESRKPCVDFDAILLLDCDTASTSTPECVRSPTFSETCAKASKAKDVTRRDVETFFKGDNIASFERQFNLQEGNVVAAEPTSTNFYGSKMASDLKRNGRLSGSRSGLQRTRSEIPLPHGSRSNQRRQQPGGAAFLAENSSVMHVHPRAAAISDPLMLSHAVMGPLTEEEMGIADLLAGSTKSSIKPGSGRAKFGQERLGLTRSVGSELEVKILRGVELEKASAAASLPMSTSTAGDKQNAGRTVVTTSTRRSTLCRGGSLSLDSIKALLLESEPVNIDCTNTATLAKSCRKGTPNEADSMLSLTAGLPAQLQKDFLDATPRSSKVHGFSSAGGSSTGSLQRTRSEINARVAPSKHQAGSAFSGQTNLRTLSPGTSGEASSTAAGGLPPLLEAVWDSIVNRQNQARDKCRDLKRLSGACGSGTLADFSMSKSIDKESMENRDSDGLRRFRKQPSGEEVALLREENTTLSSIISLARQGSCSRDAFRLKGCGGSTEPASMRKSKSLDANSLNAEEFREGEVASLPVIEDSSSRLVIARSRHVSWGNVEVCRKF